MYYKQFFGNQNDIPLPYCGSSKLLQRAFCTEDTPSPGIANFSLHFAYYIPGAGVCRDSYKIYLH
ncbi:hypothetical protein SAMN04488053_102315 [Alkalicoccus daliensis]|uniref:Uncharacterized protein n=1 Tax=Alkalicoccus daliensis TaxID=745820 RepID=A0A1H0D1X8_9BACI|nr:hypothetical protein SAMN04488053_102315 [Alkalicoccus daliensis]